MISKSGKTVLAIAQDEAVLFMHEKTGLGNRFLRLIIEIFIIIIKRILIEQGELYILGFGKFRLKIYRYKERIDSYNVFFSACDDFKEIMKGQRKIKMIPKQAFILKKKFIEVARMLGVSYEDVKYLFSLYIYCIIVYLLKYNEYKLPKFGWFKIIDKPYLKLSGLSKKFNSEVNTRQVVFKLTPLGVREINRWKRSISACKRLKRMFYFSKIDRTIKSRPRLIKDNDVPKAKFFYDYYYSQINKNSTI
jgi:nucleoid DNA-binding protein